ncbi:MAG: proton extrusion protein PcxA [Leptolyngbyaceae cyanobacterium MO_188.B28]|nr:proton extrusion protein PcxA [Leptolyngbyaceae cyanobacterium MO_188.B28]
MTSPFSKKPDRSLFSGRIFGTPEQVLEQAYEAALRIKAVEDEYFGGGKISTQAANQGIHVPSFLWADLEKDLGQLQQKMGELKANGAAIDSLDQDALMKLVFAEGLLATYVIDQGSSSALATTQPQAPSNALSPPISQRPNQSTVDVGNLGGALARPRKPPQPSKRKANKVKAKKVKNRSLIIDDSHGENKGGGVLPESIGAAINKIRNDLDPQAEQKAIDRLRKSRQRTRIGLRLLGLLIIVPIITQQVSKIFLIHPIVEEIRGQNETQVFLNNEWREEALEELEIFEQSLEFEERIIKSAPPISEEEKEKLLDEKAEELAEEFREKSNNSVSNVFADLVALLSFALVLLIRRQDIAVLKSFIDSIVTGLSDSAKAFIIILVTDVSLGFHSPHGWDVLLESMANHLGVAANKSMISLFIATVPVIVDTMFKYWVFRSLSRMSPSTVATLKEMDD